MLTRRKTWQSDTEIHGPLEPGIPVAVKKFTRPNPRVTGRVGFNYPRVRVYPQASTQYNLRGGVDLGI